MISMASQEYKKAHIFILLESPFSFFLNKINSVCAALNTNKYCIPMVQALKYYKKKEGTNFQHAILEHFKLLLRDAISFQFRSTDFP